MPNASAATPVSNWSYPAAAYVGKVRLVGAGCAVLLALYLEQARSAATCNATGSLTNLTCILVVVWSNHACGLFYSMVDACSRAAAAAAAIGVATRLDCRCC